MTKTARHPSTLSDEALLRQCDVSFGRHSGPGGQPRNKVETAVEIIHRPTGVKASAGERRRQYENRRAAIRRLRLKLAVESRTTIRARGYEPTELWEGRRQGKQLSINPKHKDYPALLAEALDVIVAMHFDVAGAAGVLGLSMSQLAKLVRHTKSAFALVNAGRDARGLARLR